MPQQPSFLIELEKVIGPADQLIVTNDTQRKNLIQWAGTKFDARTLRDLTGFRDAAQLSNVELSNLYHEHGPRATAEPKLPPFIPGTSGRFADLVRAVEAVGHQELIGQIVREWTGSESLAIREALTSYLDQRVAELNVPTRIEIAQPDGSYRPLEGLHHELTADIIQHASIADDVMMVGPAGCGKTTIGKATAAALNLPFYITSTVSDTFELAGFVDGHGAYHRTPFRNAFEHGGVWVADEIDAWDAGALLTANSALANGYMTFPDAPTTVERHPNFRVIACANTYGKGADRIYIGRNQLDAASLDRYAMVDINYDRRLEQVLGANNPDWTNYVWRIRDKVEQKNVRHVVSTRAIIKGSRALGIGMDRSKVEDRYLFKGMSEADRAKVA